MGGLIISRSVATALVEKDSTQLQKEGAGMMVSFPTRNDRKGSAGTHEAQTASTFTVPESKVTAGDVNVNDRPSQTFSNLRCFLLHPHYRGTMLVPYTVKFYNQMRSRVVVIMTGNSLKTEMLPNIDPQHF